MLGVTLLILGITCAIRESELNKLYGIDEFVNIGAFASAAVI